ncbi:MAG: DUF1016 N-terminal domain-containing protein [Chitinispirillales bacterium]|jgi:hypothetical protein|nr:DUF1016 N-terminal domain-containing protein [Chitinispirillales bacterium]
MKQKTESRALQKAGGGIEISTSFYNDVKGIIKDARAEAVRSVDFQRVLMYWKLGERIFVEEQKGEKRAKYGEFLIKSLAEAMKSEFGSGFSYRQLAFCRQFYHTYPIVNALRSQFSWTQYRLLIRIEDTHKREYYELETLNNHWTGREMERQINSMLYERLLLSNDKEAVLAVARKQRLLIEKLPDENPTVRLKTTRWLKLRCQRITLTYLQANINFIYLRKKIYSMR